MTVKRVVVLFLPLLFLACNFIAPAPNDFPSPPPEYLTSIAATPPMTVIVEFPYITASPTFEPSSLALEPGDLEDARAFLLIVKTQIAAGDVYGLAERIRYPIQVQLNGKPRMISSRDEFAANSDLILNSGVTRALLDLDEDAINVTPKGIQAAGGVLWINLFCKDPACTEKEFLVTQINN